MKVPKSLKREIGILGGGQLARMLAESAHRLGLRPVVYTDEAKCPAADIAAETITAELSNTKKLKAFVKRTEFVAFENEFVDCSLLKKTGQSLTTKFYPRLSAIELLQDKLAQKKLFKKLNLPSSPFIEVRQKRDIVRALEELEGDIVLKWSRQGYDGKGVKVVPRSQAEAGEGFFDLAIKRKIPVYAEKRIDFI